MTREEKIRQYGTNTKFDRYQDNLIFDGKTVFSFDQPVAYIEGTELSLIHI